MGYGSVLSLVSSADFQSFMHKMSGVKCIGFGEPVKEVHGRVTDVSVKEALNGYGEVQ